MLIPQYNRAQEAFFLLSPGSQERSLQLLTLDFKEYLTQYGEYSFQSFNQEKNLVKQVEKNPQAIILLPVENYRQLFKKYQLKILSIGTIKGIVTHQYILVARQGITKESMQGTVAMPYSELQGKKILRSLLGKSQAGILEVLTVPKGIDGLMSVGFGMADLALLDLGVFEQVAKVNHRLIALLKQLIISKEQFNTVVSVPYSKSKQNSDRLNFALSEMHKTAQGQRLLKFLKLDGWNKPTQQEQVNLEAQQ